MSGGRSCRSLCCRQAPVAVVDVEATGEEAWRHHLVEISVRLVDEEGIEESHYHTLLQPPGAMSATNIHGITASMVADAPRFTDVASRVAHLLDGRVLVGHGVAHDVEHLNQALIRAGQAPWQGWSLCTREAALAHALDPRRTSLSAVAAQLHICPHETHRAAGDSWTAAQVWREQRRVCIQRSQHLPALRRWGTG